jgi:hypothetical protein
MYIVVQGINATVSVISYSFANPNQMARGTIFSFIFLFIFGILLGLFSDKISVFIFKGEIDDSKEGSSIKASELQNIAFSVLGLYFIGNSIPRLVSFITSFYSMRKVPDSTGIILGGIGIISQLIIGVIIFLGSRGLVNFLDTIRNAGIKRENDYEEDRE